MEPDRLAKRFHAGAHVWLRLLRSHDKGHHPCHHHPPDYSREHPGPPGCLLHPEPAKYHQHLHRQPGHCGPPAWRVRPALLGLPRDEHQAVDLRLKG